MQTHHKHGPPMRQDERQTRDTENKIYKGCPARLIPFEIRCSVPKKQGKERGKKGGISCTLLDSISLAR